jgi:hypothetical protein
LKPYHYTISRAQAGNGLHGLTGISHALGIQADDKIPHPDTRALRWTTRCCVCNKQ